MDFSIPVDFGYSFSTLFLIELSVLLGRLSLNQHKTIKIKQADTNFVNF